LRLKKAESIIDPANISAPESNNYPVYVSYEDMVEKILVTPNTDSEEFGKTLLAICGIAYNEEHTNVCITLWKSNNEQVLGVLESNSHSTAYRILISGMFY
jgi:hypothetical protein